jgi:predicted ArsR family transcriptional regulator
MERPDDRIKILLESSKMKIGEVSGLIGLTYGTTARHLKRLNASGVLERSTCGNPWRYLYSINRQKKIDCYIN